MNKRDDLLATAKENLRTAIEAKSFESANCYALMSIAAVLLAKELREGGDVEEGESK